MEWVFAIALIVLATGLGLGALRSLSVKRTAGVGFGLCMLVATATFLIAATRLHDPPLPERLVERRPIEVPTEGFARSDSCLACHPGQYGTWAASYHSTMTQLPGRETVLGDFDNRLLRLGDKTFELTRDGDTYWVDMPNIDAQYGIGSALRVRRKIVLLTGSHHMQAYWYGTEDSRVLGILPFVHNVKLGDWYPRNACFIQPPDDEPTSEFGRWNKVCLECHVTQGRLRPFESEDGPGDDTHVAEFAITCESCHGPGEVHVEEQGSTLKRYAAHFSDGPVGNIVQPEKLPHERSAEVCGQCHSTSVWTSQEAIDEFMVEGFAYRPGDVLSDSKAIVRGKYEWNTPEVQRALDRQPDFLPNTFWSDGMNRITGREYNGLIESPCFKRGEMSCISCHQMHRREDDPRPIEEWANDQLKPGMRGNLACTQCHSEYEAPERLVEHTHHEARSTGSNCYNCHMPHTGYGLLSAVRSHQVDSPTVRAGIETGRPIACNQCHLDRTVAWTADWLERWYDQPSPPLAPVDRAVAMVPLSALRGDAGSRALAAWALAWEPALAASGDDWQGLYLGVLMGGDPYPAVRTIASRSLAKLPGFQDFEYDPVASTDELHTRGNEALQLWLRHYASAPREHREGILIGPEGPQMGRLLQLLEQRDDRDVFFAE